MGNLQRIVLWVGDLIVVGMVTLIGFATHAELGSAGWRMLTTFLPVLAAWIFVGGPVGVFDPRLAQQGRQLWRPAWAMLAAGPLAALIRALLLENRPIIPLFVLVLSGFSLLGIILWRAVYCLVFRARGG